MNKHSRSIDIRHHAIRQDYVDGLMRIGGVDTQDNTSDLLTKYLQPPLHIKHTHQLHINESSSITNTHTSLSMNAVHITLPQQDKQQHKPRTHPRTRKFSNNQTPPNHSVHAKHRRQAKPKSEQNVAHCHHAHNPKFLAHTAQCSVPKPSPPTQSIHYPRLLEP